MKILDLDESLRTENPCWKGYHPVGTKKKNGRTVPNCVPDPKKKVKEDIGSIELTFVDGTSKNIRYGSLPKNPIKSALHYFIRQRDFDTLKRIKTIDGKDVRYIVKKLLSIQESFDMLEGSDVEFQNFMSKVKHKYPDSKDKQEAFMRYVHHELEHSSQDDNSQERKLTKLENEIENILYKLSKLGSKTNSIDTEPSIATKITPPKVEPIKSPNNLNIKSTNPAKDIKEI